MPRPALLLACAVALFALLLTACDTGTETEQPEAAEPPADTPAVTPDDDEAVEPDVEPALESPMLAELVEAGELPPLEERLPATPLVVEPVERVGVHGGDWNTAMLGAADIGWLIRTIAHEQLTRWTPEFDDVIANIAEEIEVNDDASEFTFHLREGMRWSDGELFTADDIMFWYEDYLLNEELSGEPLEWMVTGSEVGVVEALDEHTVRFAFTSPNGVLLQRLATPAASPVTSMPRHYLEQFHADYAEDIDAVVAEEGFNDWIEMFQVKAGAESFDHHGMERDLPALTPWVLTTRFGDGPRMIAERNPFYWKVDTEGQQLPYFDRVVYDVVENEEVMLFMALNGEIDYHVRHFNNVGNRPVLADNREEGNYRFFEQTPSGANTLVLYLNHTHRDEAMREMFQNKDFRVGLSHAINRQEVIDIVYVGQGEPWQDAPRPESEFYNEQLATQYTEYDPDLANEHLDRAGYDQRDGAGFRLRPDGERVSFDVDTSAEPGSAQVDALELIDGYFEDVGVEMRINTMDRSLFYVRKEDNDHDVAIWGGSGGLGFDVILDPRGFFPFDHESNFAIKWSEWFRGMPGGEEPPEAPRRQMELYRELLATADTEEQNALMNEILDIAAEEFYVIGIAMGPAGYGIVKNNVHNVPEVMPGSWQYPTPAPYNPEQVWKEPEE